MTATTRLAHKARTAGLKMGRRRDVVSAAGLGAPAWDKISREDHVASARIEWMRAGNGIWHKGVPVGTAPKMGFQLWVALPPSEENAPPESIYLPPSDTPQEGPARILLGRYGQAQSTIPAPKDMNYLAVRLADGERWSYAPPHGHNVAWVAVSTGALKSSSNIRAGELVVFEESGQAIDFVAEQDTTFVLGSAIKHPHDLVTGCYSVHSSRERLAQGEAEIRRLAMVLRAQGKLG